MKLFEPTNPNAGTSLINGEASGLLNWDKIRYQQFYDIYNTLVENFWVPKEVAMSQDFMDWSNKLSKSERKAFRRIIGLLSVLDSVATRYDHFLTLYFTDSAVQAILANISNMESIHNQSYSYVLSSLVQKSEQDRILEEPKNDELLLKRNTLVFDLYQKFIDNPTKQNLFESLIGNIILEGINFTMGFAYFFHLANKGKMLGTSNIIAWIQRDESQHAYFFTMLVRILLSENPELNTASNVKFIYDKIEEAVALEKEWAEDALKDIVDIDKEEYNQYIEFIADKRLRQLGLDNLYGIEKNPMLWIEAYSEDKMSNVKQDFFEGRVVDYKKTDSDKNGFDLL